MKVISLLGMVVDSTIINEDGEFDVMFKTDKGVVIRTANVGIIDRYIVPLCENAEDEIRAIIDGGCWYMADLKFGKNPRCNRGELQTVNIFNSEGMRTTCEVGGSILEELSWTVMDDLYFAMCDEIVL